MSGDRKMLLAGKITGAYGIKGWVKVHALTDPVENFLSYGGWQFYRRKQFEDIEFVDGKVHGKGLIARIRGVDDRTAAEALKGAEVWVPEAQLPELEDGDYYWSQLEGMEVHTGHEGQNLFLGTVDHLLETGANDVLVVEPNEGSVDKRQRLIPYLIDDVIERIDPDARRIDVRWHPDD